MPMDSNADKPGYNLPKGNGDPKDWSTGKLQPDPLPKTPSKPNCQLIYKSCMELCRSTKTFCTPNSKKNVGKNIEAIGCRSKCALELALCSYKNGTDDIGGDGSGSGMSNGF